MNKKIIFTILLVAAIGLVIFLIFDNDRTVQNANNPVMTEAEARVIAEQNCIKGGDALSAGTFNDISKTWWFDANLNASRPGCNPACVVSAVAKTAEINWRCTGLAEPQQSNPTTSPDNVQQPAPDQGDAMSNVADFEKCVADGNQILESYPRQCRSKEGITFTEVINNNDNGTTTEETACQLEQRKAEVCADIYQPVCATVDVRCIKAPCEPIKETFSNICEACKNPLAKSYAKGECDDKIKAITELLKAKYPKYASTLAIKINAQTEAHARGSVSFVSGEPGGIFLAVRIEGVWRIVFDGNGQIPCALSSFSFPESMLADCAE
jgi:hypothetical protein